MNWDAASNKQRGEWVRLHALIGTVYRNLGKLFDLTEDELMRIMTGGDYPGECVVVFKPPAPTAGQE